MIRNREFLQALADRAQTFGETVQNGRVRSTDMPTTHLYVGAPCKRYSENVREV